MIGEFVVQNSQVIFAISGGAGVSSVYLPAAAAALRVSSTAVFRAIARPARCLSWQQAAMAAKNKVMGLAVQLPQASAPAAPAAAAMAAAAAAA